jgi:hypothetical protein
MMRRLLDEPTLLPALLLLLLLLLLLPALLLLVHATLSHVALGSPAIGLTQHW